MTAAMEIEKLTSLGEQAGLAGAALLDFVKVERIELKQQRDEEREIRVADRAAEREKLEVEKAKIISERENRELEKEKLQLEKDRIEAQERLCQQQFEFDKQKAQAERDFVREQADEEEKRRQIAHERRKDNDETNRSRSSSYESQGHGRNNNTIKSKVPKLPTFDERKDNIDAYLIRFERYAYVQGWPQDQWALNLSTLLSGKGLDVYYSISDAQADDYKFLKKSILNRYEMNEEGFRNKFHTCKPEEGESGMQYAHRILKYFDRWRDLADAENSKDGIIDFITRDRFLNSIPRHMSMYIREREPKDISDVAELADHYLRAHHTWVGPTQPPRGKTPTTTKPPFTPRTGNSGKPPQRGATNAGSNRFNNKPKGECYICSRPGHHARDCYKRPHLNALFGQKVMNETNDDNDQTPTDEDEETTVAFLMIKQGQHNDMFPRHQMYSLEKTQELPMMTAACHPQPEKNRYVVDGLVGDHQIKLLRDSGCDGVVIKQSLVKNSQLTGVTKTCLLIDRTVRRFPIAEIEIDTPYFTGKVSAMCVINPVHPLVLGEVSGVRKPGDPDPMWILEDRLQKERTRQPSTHNEKHIQISLQDSEITVTSDNKDNDIKEKERKEDQAAMVETRNQFKAKKKPFKPLITAPAADEIVTAESLKQKQTSDPTLAKPREMATTGEIKEGKNGSTTKYYIDKGIMYREFSSPKVQYGNQFRQVVVPAEYRRHVLQIAHESILGGHQGAKKTGDKIMENFHWPGIGADIRRYVQSCDICQRTTPKGRVTKIPLGDMPIIDTPFERVAVDLVGPIKPASERGHRYILVLVDYATRYPEAIPLKSIEAEVVAEALLEMYSRLGIPKQVLTDRGSQFMSGVMQEVSRLMSIRPLATTPYHAMCNGLVERYNGVLKSSLKKMCEERPRDWDRYIAPLFFAYRETPQSSTSFSPFELLYGSLAEISEVR